MRGLRKQFKVGLISNAWSGLRAYILNRKLEDAFDAMIISAEVGLQNRMPASTRSLLKSWALQQASPFSWTIPGKREKEHGGWHAGHYFTQLEQALKELKQLLANHN